MSNPAAVGRRCTTGPVRECSEHMNFLGCMGMFILLLARMLSAQDGAVHIVFSRAELLGHAGRIRGVERSILNLKVEAESRVEHGDSGSGPWTRTPIYNSYTCWVDGSPSGRERVDVHNEVVEWVDGAAAYIQQSYSLGYDGQHGRIARHASGPIGQSHTVRAGEIFSGPPERLKHGKFLSGVYYSLPFFDDEIYRFSEVFQLAAEPNSQVASELDFALEEFQGALCIKISSELYGITYWLDLDHGYALRGKKSVIAFKDGHEELSQFLEVTKVKEVSPGVWWPTELSMIKRPYEDGRPWHRFVYRASSVIANDPNFDETVFTVPFPKGYTVDDKVTGRKYVVGQGSE